MASLDSKLVFVLFGGVIINGYADGSFVEIEYDSDLWTKVIGADGAGVFAKSNDLSATVTLRLQPTSQSNVYLNTCLAADLTPANLGLRQIEVSDGSTGTTHVGLESRIMKPPKKVYSKGVEAMEWTIGVLELAPNLGSALLGLIT